MAPSDSSNSAERFATFAAWVHRNLLWLLIASYMLAAAMPGPGKAIRGYVVTRANGNEVTAPLLLLALLLFCAAAVVRWAQLRELIQQLKEELQQIKTDLGA